MPNGRIRIIAAKSFETDILAIQDLPSARQAEEVYLDKLRSLVKGEQAEYAGRAVDEDSGVAYQIFKLPKSDDADQGEGVTVFVEDRPATKVLASLLDDEGNVRRVRVLG